MAETIILALLVCFAIAIPANAGDSAKVLDTKIVERVNANANDAFALLERAVNINSGTMNLEGVRSVGEVFQTEFKKIGFDTRWIDMKEVNRGGHLFAEHKGKKGKRLLLIGHLDTVFEKEEPFQRFERRGTRAVGQGVNDMKGGDVIVLFALKTLHDLGLLKDTQIIVLFHGDEESSGDPVETSRRDIIAAAKRSDVALGYETCEGMATATIARRGISSWSLQVDGTQAHSSLIFRQEIGAGAVFEASRILYSFYQDLAGEQYLTFNAGRILGGTEVTMDPEYAKGTAFGKTNVIAKTVLVEGDLRFISDEQKESARARMKKIVEAHLPKTSAKIEFADGYPAMPPTEGNRRLLKMLDGVSRDLNLGPVEAIDPSVKGAADISFVAPYVDCLDGLGAMGDGGHTPKEDIDLSTFIPLIQRSAVLIYRLTH